MIQCNIDVEIDDSEIITLVEENFTFIDPDDYEEVIDGLTAKVDELEDISSDDHDSIYELIETTQALTEELAEIKKIVVALQLATGVDIDQSKNYIHSVVSELVDNCDLMLQVTNPS